MSVQHVCIYIHIYIYVQFIICTVYVYVYIYMYALKVRSAAGVKWILAEKAPGVLDAILKQRPDSSGV